jgi:hypothetical protein
MRDGKQQIWVVGAPKVGNTWLSRLLGTVLDSPVGGEDGRKMPVAQEGIGRTGKFWIAQAHSKKRETDEPIVFIYRDPRDTIVSAKFYWKMKTWSQAIDGVTKAAWPYNRVWHEFVDYWLIGGNADSVVTYEQLRAQPELHLSRVLKEIDKQAIVSVDAAVERQEFGRKRKQVEKQGDNMPYGKDVQQSMLRKGEVGDWKNHLTIKHCEIIHDRLWPWLRVLGYEKNPRWYLEAKEK